MTYQLLTQFENTFLNGPYLHRNSALGDAIAVRFYEDLFDLARSKAYMERVRSGLSVLNVQNKRIGVIARRGDGSFGEIVPRIQPSEVPGFNILRGPIATIEIGIEVKILAKAMIKQIDRVINDLLGQVSHFKSKGTNPITVGIVGINHATHYLSYEGKNEFLTDGRKYKHPIQECLEAESRLLARAAPSYDEFLVLKFLATNIANPIYDFAWLKPSEVNQHYGATLVRVSNKYDRKFGY